MSVSKIKKKNIVGFTQKHLRLLLKYCIATRNDPKKTYSKFHVQYSYYSRKQSTNELLKRAYEKKVITEPVLYVNDGIEVTILDHVDNMRELLKECEEDPKTKYAQALRGELSFIRFRRGASMLSYYENVIPSFYSDFNSSIDDIIFEEKGKLPRDPYPHGWTEKHWAVYEALRFPRRKTFVDVGKKLNLSWKTTKKYFLEVLEQCKVFTSFFPIGYDNFSYQIVTFETKYEVGVLKALQKLDHTSYIYKVNNTIILGLFLGPHVKAYQKSADHFAYLEERGIIHNLRVSIPREYSKVTL